MGPRTLPSAGSVSSGPEWSVGNDSSSGTLRIPGYHFKSSVTSSLSYNENVNIVYGYKISTKEAVVAKVSSSSHHLEREFYITKKLYQLPKGSNFIVQPLECINLASGLCASIYADEGRDHFSKETLVTDSSRSSAVSSVTARTWKAECDLALESMATRDSTPTYDLVTFLRFAIKCTECLEFIHKFNVVHGELQLSAFQWSGQDADYVKLWNFGSGFKSLGAHLTTEGWRKTAQNKELTQMLQNLVMYVSPEKTGRTAYTMDHRSDIYSLGIVFFIFLTKRNPFEGGPLDILNGVMSRPIPLVHELQLDVPEILSRIIEKMTSKAPDYRYSSAYGVREDLQECLTKLLEAGDSEMETCIPVFPLARHDIASVFTLPKTVYGRQNAISEMTKMVEQYATDFTASRIRTRHHDKSSTRITSSLSNISSQRSNTVSIADTRSESSTAEDISWGDFGGSMSVDTHSFYSGFNGSEISGARSSMLSPPGCAKRSMTVIVSLYGPGGIGNYMIRGILGASAPNATLLGKSTILSVIHPIARQKGYVATVKFDSRNKVPYSGALKALSQILQQILSEPEDNIRRFYEHLKLHIGAQFCNISLFFDSVPELLALLNASSPSDDRKPSGQIHMENIESRKKFHALYIGIFRAISHWNMVTLFLDDLHQSDINSLELLESLVASKVKLLAFISYREQEVTPKLAKILEDSAPNIHSVKAEAFDINSTIDFICDTFHRSKNASYSVVMPLANLFMQKTSGNPLYMAHLMQNLERKKLVFFNWETKQWDFNLEAIRERITHSAQTANPELDLWFMVGRLRELPSDSQTLLKWASFLGDTFSWEMLKQLMLGSAVADDTGASTSAITTSEIFEEPQHIDTSTFHPKKVQSTRPSLNHRDTSDRLYTGGSSFDPLNGLKVALQEGYFVPIGPDEFKWSHDRVAQAAGELVSSDMRRRIHLAIARYMMRNNGHDTIAIADHIMQCSDLVKLANDKDAFRRVLIEAGSRSQSSGAHGTAFAIYEAAIDLGRGSEAEWNSDGHTETLNLYTNAAALSWIAGKYERTEQLLEAVFLHARNPIDRLNAYRVQSKYYIGRQMPDNGRESLIQCIESLDEERYRFEPTAEKMRFEVDKMEQEIGHIEIEDIMNKKTCSDPLVIGIMTVIEELCTLAYWSSQLYEMYYYGMKIIKITLKEGVTDVSPVGFMFTALRYALEYKNYDFAEDLGAMGLSLLEKIGSNYIRGRIYFQYAVLVLRWKHHYREAIKYFEAGAYLSMSAGDRIYVTFHRAYRLLILFGLNECITDTLHEGEAYYEDIYTWSASDESNLLVMSIIRACKALQGLTYYHTEEVFDGDDGFNSAHFVKESCHQSTDLELPVTWYNTFKLLVQTLYGHTDAAIENGYNNFKATHHHACHRHTRIMLHYFSLALMDKLWDGVPNPEQQKKYLSQIRSNQEAMLDWATHRSANNVMFWTLLEAEMTAYENTSDFAKAALLYEDAIDQARQHGWFFHKCVAQERAGAFYFRIGMGNVAYASIKKAIDLYATNGSFGKAQQLRMKYSNLINTFGDVRGQSDIGVQTDLYPFLTSQTGWASNVSLENCSQGSLDSSPTDADEPLTTEQKLMTLDVLDMTSIIKSSCVMASEVKLEGLLISMMSIILENSGAESGAVIVKDEKFGVWAYGSRSEETRILDPPLKLSDDNDLVSTSIIHHTINTGIYTFVPSVEQDPRFTTGAWFARAGKRISVICMPIKHKDSIVGCLIIEGPLGIFTQRHITLLSLLCQQMGISMTNAFLFKSVQRVTMANTRMIEMQKQALDEARASKEAADRATRLREIFLANMSHEIRTPFSGFYGMISLLSETSLDGEQRDLVKTAKESCEMLLQIIDDLLNFSKLQAGKVTLDLTPVIVEDMITDVIEILIAMAIQKHINVTYSVSDDVPSVVMADANRLRQIIINLLGNAIKFTSKGEITIRCSVKKAEHDKHKAPKERVTLLFEVIDCGIGISEEQRRFLFAPFSQVDGSTTRKYGGTGLGLSICLQLVKLMSGHIDVISTPGKGSNFYFTIKAAPAFEKLANRNKLTASLLKELHGIRILVVAKFASTITTTQQILPNIQVDGATTISELVSRKNNDYTAIVIGLYLVKDQQFTAWSAHLEGFMEKARCVIVMHYPACGAYMGKGIGGESVSPITSPNIPVPHDPLRRQALVRITFPIRRHTLLQILVDAVHEDSSPQPAVPRPRALPRYNSSEKICTTDVSSEELELFSAMHILIAEDNPVAQKLLIKQLTRLGFQVDCANNGLEAFEAWVSHPIGYYKVGFFDHHMPKCDGVEATKLIRKAEADEQRSVRFPIIALTADVQDSAREACLNAGMDEYVTKPMNQKILVEALRRHCKSTAL